MKKFEYITRSSNDTKKDSLNNMLNEMGEKGWQLVYIDILDIPIYSNRDYTCYFMREIIEKDK